MLKNIIIVGMAAALAVSIAAAFAEGDRTANIEVRVWERVDDPRSNYVSARPVDGDWRTLGTTRLAMDRETEMGTYRYTNLRMDVPVSVVATPTPVVTEGWPVVSFDVAIATDVWNYMTVSAEVPVRFDGIMYVYVQGDPLRGNINCSNHFTLYPEDGLTGLSCSLLDIELDEITLVRVQVFAGDGNSEGYEYRCERDELSDHTWVCYLDE